MKGCELIESPSDPISGSSAKIPKEDRPMVQSDRAKEMVGKGNGSAKDGTLR